MRRYLGVPAIACAMAGAAVGQSSAPFTLQQVMSAPYATSLTAAPVGGSFAWVEDAEGRHNLFVGGAVGDARQLTQNSEDDAQDIAQIAWSPDASALAYVVGAEIGAAGKPANPAHLQRSTALQVMVQSLAGDAHAVVIDEGRSPLFLRDGRRVVYVHEGKIWVADALLPRSCPPTPPGRHGSALRELPVCGRDMIEVPRQMVFDRGNASSVTLSPDGNLLAFISTRREQGQPSHGFLAVFDLRTKVLSFPAPSTGNDSAPVFSPDGRSLAWLRSPFTEAPEFAADRVSANPWSIERLDFVANEITTVFTPQAGERGSVLPHLADGEPKLFFAANDAISFFSEADGWVHLYRVHTNGDPEVEWMTPGAFEAQDVVFSPDRPYLLFVCNQAAVNPGDRDRLHVWRLSLTQTDAPAIELTFGAGIETRPVIAGDGTVAAMVSDAMTPMHPAVIEGDGTMVALHAGAVPAGYPAGALVAPQQVVFATTPQPEEGSEVPAAGLASGKRGKKDAAVEAKKLMLHGQLFVPAGPPVAKRAAIIFVHGGPRRQMLLGYPGMDYYSNAYAMNEYMAAQGFIVLSVNYRCGIGYGMEFRQCIHAGADGAEEYNDVLAAVNYLRGRADVDAARIGIWGGSYGGYLTALALARNSNLFAAGVDFHGVHDWNLEDNAGDWRMGTEAQKDAIAAKALASSPMADLSHWTSPILLIHGDDDPDVAYAQTPVLADALRARKVPVQEMVFPDEVHGFLLHRDWLRAYAGAAAFFVRALRP